MEKEIGFSSYGSEVIKMCKMYKMYSFHGFARNVETVHFIPFLPVANPEIPLHIGKATLYDNTSPT